MSFTEKNQNRKTYFATPVAEGGRDDREAFHAARRFRRLLGGAFGNVSDFKSLDKSFLALGTKGQGNE